MFCYIAPVISGYRISDKLSTRARLHLIIAEWAEQSFILVRFIACSICSVKYINALFTQCSALLC